jgi:hypothetical protein
MRRPQRLLTAISLMILASVCVKAQKVSVGADPAVDLTKYKSYMWSNIASPNPLAHDTVVTAVDGQLAAKGLTRVNTGAELTVVVFGSSQSDVYVSNPSWAPSLNSIATGVAVGSQSWLVTKGTLVVDLLDTKTNNSVWRGQATDTLDRGPTGDKVRDAKTVEKPIRNAIKKMFKQFPHPNRK